MGDTRENKTEPFEGKTQTELEDHPTEVQRTRGRRQSWKRSAGKTCGKKQEGNASGTRAEKFVEDWHRTKRKIGILPMDKNRTRKHQGRPWSNRQMMKADK